MTHDELRALARQLVADRVRERGGASATARRSAVVNGVAHASHDVYVIVNSSSACVIEPDVECTHCNYCKSHGY